MELQNQRQDRLIEIVKSAERSDEQPLDTALRQTRPNRPLNHSAVSRWLILVVRNQ